MTIINERFKFMNDACAAITSDDTKKLRTVPPTTETLSVAAGLGAFMGLYFEMDQPNADEIVLMEALRDGLPALGLEPEVANIIVETARATLADKAGATI